MKRSYAIARLQWTQSDSVNWPVVGFFCRPALFHAQPDTLWSLCVRVNAPAFPGDITEAPVALMTLEKEGLITLGATFDLMPSGPSIVARGRVISIHAMEEEEMMRTIFRARDD